MLEWSWVRLLPLGILLPLGGIMLKWHWRPILALSIDEPQCEEQGLLENGHPAAYIRAAISNVGSDVATASVFLDEICFESANGVETMRLPRSPLQWTNTESFEAKKLYGRAPHQYVDICSTNTLDHLLRPRSEKGISGGQGKDSTFHAPGIYVFRVVAEAQERFSKPAKLEVRVFFGARLEVLKIFRPPTVSA